MDSMKTEKGDTKPLGRILIAEDDADFRRILSRRAMRMGLEVEQVPNGKEAIEAVKQGEYDALVVDLYMPEFGGLEVIEAARVFDPDIESLILTGSASVETAVEALRAGVYDYLTKPLESMTEFEMALKRALERRHLIRENKRLFEENKRLAVTDPLTGLNNRHKLQEVLSSELERASRYSRPLSIIMVDMDDLKGINDSLGHPVGDEALKMVASAIQRCVRKVDLATRFGGDEFVIVLPEADLQVAASVAERLHKEVAKLKLEGCSLSVSLGVAAWNKTYTTPEIFIDAADRAMYQAKRSEGEQIRIAKIESSS
jgi:two-component system cell cycle response regulator